MVKERKVGKRRRGALAQLRAKLFAEHDFITAYRMMTDSAVELDPERAIGGHWEEIGQLQFRYLVDNGLLPHHKMLDIGCGTLRGGRHFIRYLDPGNYFGFDISPKAIEYGARLVVEEGLSDKTPDLRAIPQDSLRFEAYAGQRFDFILAQSVFSHLGRDLIEECFAHVASIMGQDSRFFFTFLMSLDADSHQFTPTGFRHPVAFFEELAVKYGFRFVYRPDYAKVHPRKQHMAIIQRA